MSAKINKIILFLFHFEEKNVGGPIKQVKKKCGLMDNVWNGQAFNKDWHLWFSRVLFSVLHCGCLLSNISLSNKTSSDI